MSSSKRIAVGGLVAVALVAGLAGSVKADTFVWISDGSDYAYVSTPSSWSCSYTSYGPSYSSTYREVSYGGSTWVSERSSFDDNGSDVTYLNRTSFRSWSSSPSYYSEVSYADSPW
jgi:hypothetical protein